MSLHKIIAATALMFTFGCTAHAHPNHRVKPTPQVSVSFHWVWIDGHRIGGHYANGHWVKRPGRHPHARHPDWRWIAGQYVGHGPHRHWVPGHWKRRR